MSRPECLKNVRKSQVRHGQASFSGHDASRLQSANFPIAPAAKQRDQLCLEIPANSFSRLDLANIGPISNIYQVLDTASEPQTTLV
jgi:hypothetical protein